MTNRTATLLNGLIEVEKTIDAKVAAGEYKFSTDDHEHINYPIMEKALVENVPYNMVWLSHCINPMLAASYGKYRVEDEDDSLPETVYQDFMDGQTIIFSARFFQICSDCQANFYLHISLQDEVVHIHVTTKTMCEKNYQYFVEVDFPTGEVIVDDWPPFFREFVDAKLISRSLPDVNYVGGMKESSEEAARDGYAHFYVGNTCPSIWQEDGLKVGNLSEDREDESMGSVCTDLWWTTMIDVSLYKKYLEAIGKQYSETLIMEESKNFANIINIEPGRYRIKPYYGFTPGINPYGSDATEVYASIDRIGDCA